MKTAVPGDSEITSHRQLESSALSQPKSAARMSGSTRHIQAQIGLLVKPHLCLSSLHSGGGPVNCIQSWECKEIQSLFPIWACCDHDARSQNSSHGEISVCPATADETSSSKKVEPPITPTHQQVHTHTHMYTQHTAWPYSQLCSAFVIRL